MRRTLVILSLMLAITLAAPLGFAAPGAVRCGKLLDARSGRMLTDQVIVFDANGMITAAGAAASTSAPGGAAPIDLSNATCLPGLIDVHTHLTGDPSSSGYQALGISVPREALTGAKNARLTVRAGFTTVRNVGATGYTDVALRDAIDSGDVEGPRMLVSGPPLGITGGHCDNNLLPFEYHYKAEGVADGPWAARAKVRETIKYGADLIKVCASGGVLSKGDQPGTPQYTLEELQAIAEEAHKLGRKVAAHAHGTQSIKDGILAESIEKEKKIGRLQRENFRHAFQSGAKIAFGTDAGVYPHGDNARQFAKMVEWGMKPIDAIQAATIRAADLLGWSAKAGVLEADHYADIIAVSGDPLSDVRVLESVKFVMKNGAVVRNDFSAK